MTMPLLDPVTLRFLADEEDAEARRRERHARECTLLDEKDEASLRALINGHRWRAARYRRRAMRAAKRRA